ncbi:hypothetical protein ACQ4PT_010796 [Festuca glaucescens]
MSKVDEDPPLLPPKTCPAMAPPAAVGAGAVAPGKGVPTDASCTTGLPPAAAPSGCASTASNTPARPAVSDGWCTGVELDLIVVENILAFSEGFWVRLAARIDLCKSDDDKKDYEELAENIMNIVDRVVHKTDEKIEQSTDVLKAIISPVMQEGEEVMWPPRNPEALKLMEKEISNREKEGQLDESFLSEVNAQLRQVKGDGDKPGLQVMLQKVLQLYASNFLRKRSYAHKGGEVVVPEKFLESIIEAPESDWNKLLLDGLTVGKGVVSPEEFHAVTKKRIERILIRTEGGSYQQRVLVEYIKEIQARAEEIVNRLQGPAV